MRTHFCGEVTERLDGEAVAVCGWLHRRRDHGGVIFIDLRDRSGLLQIVIDPDTPEAFALADRARSEYVLRVEGRVRHRPEGTENPELATGRVEVLAKTIEVLNESRTPPFQLDDEAVNEETRLRYRYVDLRRPRMHENLRLRSEVTRTVRAYLDSHGFLDVETPMLTKATPEGARDYLVPSRTQPGRFFALPQSPQLFKQLLMMSGVERYYQIVRCFRDEDLRADRQPEFTQIDIETSFLPMDEFLTLMEGMVRDLFARAGGVDLPDPLPRLTWSEAMERFGTDRPDLRIGLELVEVADLVRDCEFKVFAGPARNPRGRVAALRVPGGGAIPRSRIDGYTGFVGQYGAKGLAWIRVNDTNAEAATASSPPSSSSSTTGRSRASSSGPAPRTEISSSSGRTTHGWSTTRSARSGSGSAGTRGSFGTVGRRSGWSTSRCSSGTSARSGGRRCTTPSPRRPPKTRRPCGSPPATASRRHTTSWSTATSWGAAPCASTVPRCSRPRFGCSGSGRRRRRRSSASCSSHSSTDARPTAGSRWASTAS